MSITRKLLVQSLITVISVEWSLSTLSKAFLEKNVYSHRFRDVRCCSFRVVWYYYVPSRLQQAKGLDFSEKQKKKFCFC